MTATVTTTPAYYGIWLYVKAPGDTTYRGTQIKGYSGDGTSTQATLTYTFPTDAATGDYKITAYIFPYVNGTYGTGYEVSQNASVTQTTPTTPTTPTFALTVSGIASSYNRGDTISATVSTGAPCYGVYLYVWSPGSSREYYWFWGSTSTSSVAVSYTIPSDAQTGSWTFEIEAYAWNGNTYGEREHKNYSVTVQ